MGLDRDIISLQEVCHKTIKFLLGINSLSPRWNKRTLADDIFRCIFLNE